MEHTHGKEIPYGFPTIFGRGLLDEFKHFVNPPFLVVTMEDLWPMFGHHFEGAECQTYFCGSIEQDDLNKEAEILEKYVRLLVLEADRPWMWQNTSAGAKTFHCSRLPQLFL